MSFVAAFEAYAHKQPLATYGTLTLAGFSRAAWTVVATEAELINSMPQIQPQSALQPPLAAWMGVSGGQGATTAQGAIVGQDDE